MFCLTCDATWDLTGIIFNKLKSVFSLCVQHELKTCTLPKALDCINNSDPFTQNAQGKWKGSLMLCMLFA